MKRSSEYPSWELHSRKLSEQEASDPHLVFDEFFDYASLPQVRDKLWAWLETTASGNFSQGLKRRQREHILLFYTQLEKLIEAVHVLHARRQKGIDKNKKPKSGSVGGSR